MDQESLAKAFGEAVRRLRTEMGFSQEAFADAVGIHRTSMGSIERGKSVVSLFTAYKIAEALGCSVSDLMRATFTD